MDNRQFEKHIRDLKNEDSDVRYEAVCALGKIGEEYVVPVLIEALADEDYMVRQTSLRVLGKIGAPALPALIEALRDHDALVRSGAVESLRIIRDPATVPALTEVLQDRNEEQTLRCEVVYTLGAIKDTSVIPILMEALKDQNHPVGCAAAYALGKIGDWSALSILVEALKDEDAEVRWNAADALTWIGKPAVPVFVDTLRGPVEQARLCALYGLGVVGDVSTIPLLMDVLQTGAKDARFYAAVALENIGDSKTLPRNILAYSAWSAEERAEILETLRSVRYEGGNFVGYKFDGYKAAVYYKFPDTLTLCRAVLKEKDAAAHAGAQEVLNWLLLLRGSQPDTSNPSQELVRAVSGSDHGAEPETLLRPGQEPDEEVQSSPVQPTLWKRLFGKRNEAS